MSEKETNKVKVDVSASLISALSEGNVASLKNLVHEHGMLNCAASYGGYTLLRDAIQSGHYDIAKFLLHENVKVDCVTDRVDTLLHYATEKGWAEFVGLLLERNAPIDARNSQNETPLHLAVKKGFSNIVKVLLNNNASLTAQTDEGSTPLLLAIENKCEEIVRMILEHAQDEKIKRSISSAEDENSTILDRILLCSPSAREKVNQLVVRFTIHRNGYKIIDDLIDHGFFLCREYVNEQLLYDAIVNSQTKLIKNILSIGIDLNTSEYNPSLLRTAVTYGHIEIVKLFLNSGLDVNAKDVLGQTPACCILECGEEDKAVEILQLLLASGADIKTSYLLHEAVENGWFEVCKVLIESGALINGLDRKGNTPLHLAAPKKESKNAYKRRRMSKKQINEMTRVRIIKLFLNSHADVSIRASKDGLTAFHRAVKNGRKEAVCAFLDFGIDVNLQAENGTTPLHLAAAAGHQDILEILFDKQADVNARLENGATPLHLAAKNRHDKVVIMLCKKGATVDARQENGWTTLHCAATGQKAHVVETLINLGVDVNARGATNETALHCAMANPNRSISASLLLENGCDINAETVAGETALDIAIADAREYFAESRRDMKHEGTTYEVDGFDFVHNYDDSHDEHSDFDADEYATVKALKRYLVKLKVGGLYVSERNLDLLDDECLYDSDGEGTNEISNFEQECEEEVNRMKEIKLNPQISLFDMLKNSNNLTYAKNKPLMESFQSFNLEEIRIYGGMIKGNFKRNILRLELMGSGQKSLNLLVKTSTKLNGTKTSVLPEELLELIVSYLDNHELKCLISCGGTLRHQLRL